MKYSQHFASWYFHWCFMGMQVHSLSYPIYYCWTFYFSRFSNNIATTLVMIPCSACRLGNVFILIISRSFNFKCVLWLPKPVINNLQPAICWFGYMIYFRQVSVENSLQTFFKDHCDQLWHSSEAIVAFIFFLNSLHLTDMHIYVYIYT